MDGLSGNDTGMAEEDVLVNDNGLDGQTRSANDTGTAGETSTAKDYGSVGEKCTVNDAETDYGQRAGDGKVKELVNKTSGRKYLKEATVIVNVEKVNQVRAMDIIDAVTEVCGQGKILALRPRQGKEYELTMEKEESCEKLMDGLTIRGESCEVKRLQNKDHVVSFMHLPVYLDDNEILIKLEGWRVTPISQIKRRYYPGTNIEDGTRFLRVRFPKEVTSLPYSTKLETADGVQYFRVLHSHQVKTCRLCMSPEHLLKDCPDFKCYKCEERGHFARECNAVRCPECREILNKCECWMEEEEGGQENQMDGQVHERNNNDEGHAGERQELEGLQLEEAIEASGNSEERKEEEDKGEEQSMEQDTQGTQMELSESFLNGVEKDNQREKDQSKETERGEETKKEGMDKDSGVRGQRRRRISRVKPNVGGVRKNMMTRSNRYDVLRGLEEKNDK